MRIARAIPERVSFAITVVLLFAVAFDWQHPVVPLPRYSLTIRESLVLSVIGVWLLAKLVLLIERTVAPGAEPRLIRHASSSRMLALSVLVWVAVQIIAAFVNPSNDTTLIRYSFQLISSVMIGWIVFDLTDTVFRQQIAAKAFVLGGIVVASIGILERANYRPVIAWLSGFNNGSVTFAGLQRISSTLPHPNLLAMMLELVLPLALAWFLISQHKWQRILLGVGIFVVALATVLTLSRGGLLASLAGLATFAALSTQAAQRRETVGGIAVGALLVILTIGTIAVNPLLMVRALSEGSNERWYGAEYQVPSQLSAAAGTMLTTTVTVTNLGLINWESDGSEPFVLSYHILSLNDHDTDDNGASIEDIGNQLNRAYVLYEEGIRTSLPANVAPNQHIELTAEVVAPTMPGTYAIEWDMLHTHVTWFSQKNVTPELTHLTVTGSPSEGTPRLSQLNTIIEKPELKDMPGRLFLWSTAWQMFVVRPLLGIGPNNFAAHYSEMTGLEPNAYHAHNLWIGWLAETGIVGFLAFLWVVWSMLRLSWRGMCLQSTDVTSWIWWMALMAAFISLLVHGLVDSTLSDVTVFLAVCMVAGLLVSMAASAHPTWSVRDIG